MTQEAVLMDRAAMDAEVEGKTIVDYFNRNVQRYGDQPAIHFKENGEWTHLTWKQYSPSRPRGGGGIDDARCR